MLFYSILFYPLLFYPLLFYLLVEAPPLRTMTKSQRSNSVAQQPITANYGLLSTVYVLRSTFYLLLTSLTMRHPLARR